MSTHEHQHQHHGHQHHGHHGVDFDSEAMAETAEVEAEALGDLLDGALTRLVDACAADGLDVQRVIDVGCGPGVATCRLAARFPHARLVAADASATMLARAAARAEREGLGERIEIHRLDLPDGLAALGRAEVVWASLVIHHVGDETTALRRVHDALAGGGLLALVEIAEPVRLELDEHALGRPGLWDRIGAAWTAWFAGMRSELPGATRSDAYPAMLAAAGFEVVVDEVLETALAAPLTGPARRFARRQVQGTRSRLADRLDDADLEALATLDALLGDDDASTVERGLDVGLRASRHLYLARAIPG